MVSDAHSVYYEVTDSVLEAILLEASLIKKLQPKYNTDEKDDKSFNCIGITKEDFPRVLLIRSRDISSGKLLTSNFELLTYFGPFPHGTKLQEALKLVRKIFPFRDSKCAPQQGRPCFNRQIGLCPGTCTGEISKRDYSKTIRSLKLFFEGKKSRLLSIIEKEMRIAAKAERFELAGELKRQLYAIKHIQDVALLQTNNKKPTTYNYRIEAYDLSHFGGKDVVGAMAVVEDGQARPSEYRLFKIRGANGANEVKGLEEVLSRRLRHSEWPYPHAIVVDGNEVQRRAAQKVLAALKLAISVVAVVKNEKHRPDRILGAVNGDDIQEKDILLANSEAHRFVLQFQKRQRKL